MFPQLNRKICLKSAGLYEFFDWFCVVLFEGKSTLKKCLNFNGLSMQEAVGQHFPRNWSKIGHSYEAYL